jgi:hypothetical protein
MKRRKKRAAVPLPLMMAETALSSWETIAHRTCMMAQGRCSPAEYQRMVLEKAQAAQLSAKALARRGGIDAMAAALTPWHRRATANAKRLRKR